VPPAIFIVRRGSTLSDLADMYFFFSVQNYPPANPRPYDDTGWTMQYMRNVKLNAIADKPFSLRPMTLLSADARRRAPSLEQAEC